MKRVIIVCEGQTEQEFCKHVLQPHFTNFNVFLQWPCPKKTGGGICRWEALKYQIERHLLQDKFAIVTTLFDYYGITSSLDFPKWENHKQISDKLSKLNCLENAMKEDIREDLRNRFIPYIQLHEFEGLLFNDLQVFTDQIPPSDLVDLPELKKIIQTHPNPELINDNQLTAPSYRLKNLIKGYDKIVYGPILAEKIGLAKMRSKAVRFNDWTLKLETLT